VSAPEQRQLRARMAQLTQAVAFIEDFCERHGLSRDDAKRLALIVEELFSNTVRHGHGGDSDAPVRVALSVAVEHVTLHYEDAAPPFDPLQHVHTTPRELDAEIDQRGIGGLGMHLVAQLAERIDYSYAEGCNRLQLLLRREH
jgi:anti-sigma regulatory factor (Ser/Thr protein kinase)